MNSFLVCSICGTANLRSQIHCLACKQPLSESTEGRTPSRIQALFPLTKKVLKLRYRVLFAVGKGGMGTVYIGKDMQLGNRLVAIKEMIQDGLSPYQRAQAARNFRHEAHLLAGLQHPHLPSIYDHFEEDQRWYLVMSFIKGQTLKEYLELKHGMLPVQEVIEIGIALCDVLHYLHTHHPPIIFRDLKPSNIMRTTEGHIYLIDFGIARLFKPGQLKDTTDRGSPGYAAPEQFGKTQTTPGSDIYSLGVILYQMFSGHYIATTSFRYPPLESRVSDFPRGLAILINQMLDIDEQKRPRSMEIVKRELQNSVKHDSTPATLATSGRLKGVRPTPLTPLFIRPEGELVTIWILIGMVVLLLILVAIGLTTTLFKTNTPSDEVKIFCDAMNSATPDFQTAYNQLSRRYQREHSLISFQEYFQGTRQCVVASSPDEKNQAGLSLGMVCPPDGGPPPGSPPPNGPPPSRNKPTNITLVHDGNTGWKIDSMYVVGYDCSFQRGVGSPPQQ